MLTSRNFSLHLGSYFSEYYDQLFRRDHVPASACLRDIRAVTVARAISDVACELALTLERT